jgi:beta-xylosidase
VNKKEILQQPVLYSTILKYDNRYWLFATFLGAAFNSDLQIFYADNLMGPYTPHAGNPVKQAHNGARPAGNFIEVDGSIYRPAQNCGNYYGESITINRITKLTTAEFEEEEYMIIRSNKNDEFNYGIHTINAVDDLVIVDGQKGYFEPMRQLTRKLKTIFN